MTKKDYLIDFYFNTNYLLDWLSTELVTKDFPENPKDIEKLNYKLGCLLEKPSLKYTFEDVFDLFAQKDMLFSDVLDGITSFDLHDDLNYNLIMVDGTLVTNRKYCDLESHVLLSLTDSELRDIVKSIWEFILFKSIRIPVNRSAKDCIYWAPDSVSAELINEVNNLIEEKALTFLPDLVNSTLQKDVLMFEKSENLVPNPSSIDNLKGAILTALEPNNIWK